MRDTQLLAHRARDGRGCLGGTEDRRCVRIAGDIARDVFVGLGINRRPVGLLQRLVNQRGGDFYRSYVFCSCRLALRTEINRRVSSPISRISRVRA